MNDDWDGVDWAAHFSCPDDDEIEQLQAGASQVDRNDDGDEHPDDAHSSPEATLAEADELLSSTAQFSYAFEFDTVDELNIFTNHARQIGARNIKVKRHEPLEDWYIEDNKDDEEVRNFKHFTVTLNAASSTNFSFYRSGLRYQLNEKSEIIERYLDWTHVDQIAVQFKRTPTAICALLQKEGYFFHPKPYLNPDDSDEEYYVTNEAGYSACEMLKYGVESGICTQHLASFVGLDAAALRLRPIYINDLSNADKRRLIYFAASSVSLDVARHFARQLKQWRLLYFLALQSRDLTSGLEALNNDVINLNGSLETTRLELLSFLRYRASEKMRIPLLNWWIKKDIRYKPQHPATLFFKHRLIDFQTYYQSAFPTYGFAIPDTLKLLLAVLCCDFETLELLAREGSIPARWFCCDRAIAAMNSTDPYRCDSDWAGETDSLDFGDQSLFDMLHDCLPYDSVRATKFELRIRSQNELDAVAQKAWELQDAEIGYQS